MEKISMELTMYMQAGVGALLQTLLLYLILPLLILGGLTFFLFQGNKTIFENVFKVAITLCLLAFFTSGLQYMNTKYEQNLSFIEEKHRMVQKET